MVITEGRKEEILTKYSQPILAEKKLVKEYLTGGALGSIYDYLITDLFMIESNFKYLDDILRNYYSDWKTSAEDLEPLSFENAKRWVMSKRDEMDRLVEALKFFDVHNKKYKHQEFRKYADNDLFDFLKETDELRENFNKKKGQKEVEKVFENDRVLVVRPKTYEASCVYGAGTRWCTSSKSTSSHFENYTETGFLYYFLTKGVDSSNKFYKVALYRDDAGQDKWYDATDRELSENEIELLTSAYGDALKNVDEDFSKLKPNSLLNLIFPKNFSIAFENRLLSGKPPIDLNVSFNVKETIEPSISKVKCFIYQIEGTNEKIVGNYMLVIFMKCTRSSCTYGVAFTEPTPDSVILDDNQFIMYINVVGKSPEVLREQTFRRIYQYIEHKFRNNPKYLNSLVTTDEILVPAANKGYSFKYRDRGLIKKLTDWLDSGKKTDKVDFLIGTNILKKQGNNLISTSTGTEITPRGYLSGFFQAAKAAGIIDYRKVGRKTIITKGPNYRKFKKGAQIRYF